MQSENSRSYNIDPLIDKISQNGHRILLTILVAFTGKVGIDKFSDTDWSVPKIFADSSHTNLVETSQENNTFRALTPDELVPGNTVLMRSAYNERMKLSELTEDDVTEVVIQRIFEYKVNKFDALETRVLVNVPKTQSQDMTLADYLFVKK